VSKRRKKSKKKHLAADVTHARKGTGRQWGARWGKYLQLAAAVGLVTRRKEKKRNHLAADVMHARKGTGRHGRTRYLGRFLQLAAAVGLAARRKEKNG
jgi:hypothetical protein